jgi:hypothetical protein
MTRLRRLALLAAFALCGTTAAKDPYGPSWKRQDKARPDTVAKTVTALGLGDSGDPIGGRASKVAFPLGFLGFRTGGAGEVRRGWSERSERNPWKRLRKTVASRRDDSPPPLRGLGILP